jgi:nicotinamidase/pyrazinamidase
MEIDAADPSTALVVVDVQNDFCPGGALAVPGGDEVVPVINDLAGRFVKVVLTQDWHPRGHVSFASSHEGKEPQDTVQLDYGEQILWPDHCVPGTRGAELHEDLDTREAQAIIRKGYDPGIDSYSAFFENDRRTPTGLRGYLETRSVQGIVVVGLAADVCVQYTALDAREIGLSTVVLVDATRGIDMDGSLEKAWDAMRKAGVELAESGDVGP